MRWIFVALIFCLVVASARCVNKNRMNRMPKSMVDIEHDINDNWSDSDEDMNMDDDDYEDDQMHPPKHRHQLQHHQHQQQKHRPQQGRQLQPHIGKYKKEKWMPQNEDEDEYYQNQEPEYAHQKKQQKRHYNKHDDDQEDEQEPQKPCQPNFELLQNMDQINTQLAARLHQEAKKLNDDQNTIVSPVAVQLALAAVNQGARGNTKRQINQILDYGMSKDENQDAYMALVKILKGQGPDQSGSKSLQVKSTTNIILSQQSADEQFIESIKTCFDGEVKRCDFHAQPQKCRDQINQWISTKTSQKLQHPLSQNAVTQNTKMISVNTMQVKTTWDKQTKKQQKVGQGQFYPLGEQKSVTVKTLQCEGDFNYFEDNQLRILGIQTQDMQLTVYIVLPKQKHGLNKLETQRLQYGKQLQKLMDDCDSRRQSLRIQLPFFQVVHKMDAKDVLRKLGIEDAFDFDKADFSGIHDNEMEKEHLLKYGKRQTGGLEDVVDKRKDQRHHQKTQYLHLNKLIQQATIEINENGIDAASNQNMQQQGGKQKKDDREEEETNESDEFKVDHAFAFMVKHNPSNQLLFIGRVVDPTQNTESDQSQNERENGI